MVGQWLKADFNFPKCLPRGYEHRFFTPQYRAATISKGRFPAAASQCLRIFPMLLHFVETALPQHARLALQPTLHSMGCLADATGVLLQTRSPGSGRLAGTLQAAVSAHLAAFVAAHGEQSVHPKHHVAMHLADQLRADDQSLDCFTAERKNKVAKESLSNQMQSGMVVQKCQLSRMVAAQLRSLSRDSLDNRFLGKVVYGPVVSAGATGNPGPVRLGGGEGLVRGASPSSPRPARGSAGSSQVPASATWASLSTAGTCFATRAATTRWSSRAGRTASTLCSPSLW